jgi:hypothetical protein
VTFGLHDNFINLSPFLFVDSLLEVGLNSRCLINRLFKEGDISQHQKDLFYQAARMFYATAFKYALDNLPHSDDLLKSAEVINWAERRKANLDGIINGCQKCNLQI